MIEALKDDRVYAKVGGQFQFTALVQHRMRELMEDARPLIDRKGMSNFEVAVQEVVQGKIAPRFENSDAGKTDDEAPDA